MGSPGCQQHKDRYLAIEMILLSASAPVAQQQQPGKDLVERKRLFKDYYNECTPVHPPFIHLFIKKLNEKIARLQSIQPAPVITIGVQKTNKLHVGSRF